MVVGESKIRQWRIRLERWKVARSTEEHGTWSKQGQPPESKGDPGKKNPGKLM